MGDEETFEARIALLEEMLAAALRDVNGRAYALIEGQRHMSHHEAGFAVALDVYGQWKAIAVPKAHAEKPLEMPRVEEGIGG